MLPIKTSLEFKLVRQRLDSDLVASCTLRGDEESLSGNSKDATAVGDEAAPASFPIDLCDLLHLHCTVLLR